MQSLANQKTRPVWLVRQTQIAGAIVKTYSVEPQSTGAGVALKLVLEAKPEHRTPFRPNLDICIGSEETGDLAVFIHVQAMHGYQERIIELSPKEARRLARLLTKRADEIDDHCNAAKRD